MLEISGGIPIGPPIGGIGGGGIPIPGIPIPPGGGGSPMDGAGLGIPGIGGNGINYFFLPPIERGPAIDLPTGDLIPPLPLPLAINSPFLFSTAD